MSRRHLITGAQGLIGRHLAAHLLASDPAATVLGIGRSPRDDRFFTHAVSWRGCPRRAPVPRTLRRWLGTARYGYQSLSLADAGSLQKAILEFRPDCVFHLASALHSAPERELTATNVAGTASLLRALEGTGTRVVLGSSASVYGSPGRLPIGEGHPCVPVNAYGSTKLAAEQLAARHGKDVVIARVFNVVGPGQSEDHVCGRLASQVAATRTGERSMLSVGPLIPTRDFIDVRDVAAALVAVADRAPPGSAVNVASGVEVSVGDVLAALVRLANVEITVSQRGDAAPGVSRCVADVTLLRDLGFHRSHGMDESLRDLLEWYRQLEAPDHRGV